MTRPTNYGLVSKAKLTALSAAIQAQDGQSGAMSLDAMAARIAALSSGGGGAVAKDINFYDYDGRLLHSYWLSELPLAALPAAPEHSNDEVPLSFQQWTHTLAQVNACTERLNVGATLVTTDGKTHLIVNIADAGRLDLPLYISQSVSNGVSIDWGDGSAAQTLAGVGYLNTVHSYAAAGRYDISLSVASGCTLGLGRNLSSYCLLGFNSNNGRVYCNMLQAAFIGDQVTAIADSAFRGCYSLSCVSIPRAVTDVGDSAFYNCYALSGLAIPQGVSEISGFLCQNCYSLASVCLPTSVASIGNSAFRGCSCLSGVCLPQAVSAIGSYAFYNCCALAYACLPAGLSSIASRAFYNCYSLARVSLPSSLSSIVDNVFYNCSCLVRLSIPAAVSSIGDNAFNYCYAMAVYDFSACTAVPTLASAAVFGSIPDDCIMLIPSALLSQWSAAANWSSFASHMQAA